jgi:6,7-dimethyl-8-ribityllumazine synthase
MATINKNLSDFDYSKVPSAANMRIGIVVAEWNSNITEGLYEGAMEALQACGCPEAQIFRYNTPGSFELPLGAQWVLEHKEVDAVICLGSVIQGETKHFDFVCQGTALGIKDVSLKYNKPVIFGVLTDNTLQQAIDRSGGKHGNKGTEAAVTAIQMVALQKELEA